MKKIFLFVACASLMVMGAKAQTAEELFKAGKAEFDRYDKLFGEYTLAHGQNPDAPDATIGERATALMNGFDMLQKALPLDTIIEYNKDGSPKIDKKTGQPKFKTKFSKDIVALLSGHINDVLNVGNAGLMGNDFATSFKAFKFFSQLVGSSLTEGVQFDQSTLADVAFYEGYSAYQLKDFDGAYNAFKNAISKGYTENQVVDFRNSCLANIIQGFCDTKDYDNAFAYIDKAISEDPSCALLYDMKGFVVEQKDGLLAAEPYYEKAVETDDTFPNGFFDLGRVIYEKAEKIIEDNPKATNAELKPKLVPLYDKALPLFKKAHELDPESAKTQSKRFIEDIEYKLDLLK
jgi:tetratricopeptide (TPR) repeat protein